MGRSKARAAQAGSVGARVAAVMKVARMLRWLYLAALGTLVCLVLGAGCGFDPELGAGGDFACGAGDSCPANFVCAFDKKCYPSGRVPTPPSSNDGGGPPPAPGPGASRLSVLDAPPVIEGNAASADAGADAAVLALPQAIFQVKLDVLSTSEVKVDFATANGTAFAGKDYVAKTGTLTFPPGTDTQTIRVDILGDDVTETTATFTVSLSNPVGASILDGDATGTIQDDDATPEITIGDSVANEGNSGTTAFTFAVTLSNPSASTVTVQYAAQDGTAKSASPDNDYQPQSGTISFAPGTTSKTVTVQVTGDLATEPNEKFSVVLTSPTNATIAQSTGFGTIKDDDGVPTITIADPQPVAEGSSVPPSSVSFVVTLSKSSSDPVSIGYATSDGTAMSGSDFQTTAGTLQIPANTTTATIIVPLVGDALYESTETFTLTLTNPTNAVLGDKSVATATITDDDALPTLSIDSPAATKEGNSGAKNVTFKVTLSGSTSLPVSVDFTTQDETASAGSDYVKTSGTLTFASGINTQTVTVRVNGDALYEGDETFTVKLTNPLGAAIASDTGTGTITDDDTAPTLAIGDVSIAEGNSGTETFSFPVTLSAPSGVTVTVAYATADDTAKTADADYTPSTGTLTFLPNETSKTVSVSVVGDAADEGNETFFVNLSSAVNATIADAQGIGTILNDDGSLPTLSVANASATEGSGVTFTVTLNGTLNGTVTVDYALANGTAIAGTDYTTTSGTLNFTMAGSTTITVATTQDTLYETNETFTLALSNATNANVGTSTATGTITDDDVPPTLAISSPSVTEGAAGTQSLTFTVTQSAASGRTTTVDFATANGTATTATGCGGSDYNAAQGTLTFAPGVTTQTIDVTVNGDTLNEPDETVLVNLLVNPTIPMNATIQTGTGTGTITNDDAAPTLSINDVTALEGNSGVTPFTFTVSLSAQTSKTVSVNYATADGTATAASGDYTAIASTALSFAGCTDSKTITVDVSGDTAVEPSETFTVGLSGATNVASISKPTGTGTITSDDNSGPTLSIDSLAKSERGTGSSNTVIFTFNVSLLSPPSTSSVSVDWSTVDGTATAASGDYVSATGTLTFAAGQTSQTIDVTVNKDDLYELDETFSVVLSNAMNATIVTSTGIGAILNDEKPPTVSIDSPGSITEGDTGTKNLAFTISLSTVSGAPMTVTYATADGSALAGSDYASTSGTVTIPAGQTSVTITVPIVGDNVYELGQTFVVKLTSPVGATLGTSSGTGTILDNDPKPTISITADVSKNEGANGQTTAFDFVVSLTNPSETDVTVTYATADGTASAGPDYTQILATPLTIGPLSTQATISVSVKGDKQGESNETFTVNLSTPSANATLGTASGIGTIVNDD